MSNAFSSPGPLGLISNEPVALDATENTNFLFGWREYESAEQIKNIIYRALTFYFLPSRTANKKSVSGLRRATQFCFVSIYIECNAIAVKKRIEGHVWEVFTRTTSLDKERLPWWWVNFASDCVSTVAFGETERRSEWPVSPCSHGLKVKNRAIDTCMALLNLINLPNSSGYSSVIQ